MNDEEFVFRKLFKIEIQKIGPINSDHAQNRFPPEIRSLISRNFRTLRKVLLIHAEMIEL